MSTTTAPSTARHTANDPFHHLVHRSRAGHSALRHDPVMFRHTLAFSAASFPAHATRRLLHDVSAHGRSPDGGPSGRG